jgi:hypothetical protein
MPAERMALRPIGRALCRQPEVGDVVDVEEDAVGEQAHRAGARAVPACKRRVGEVPRRRWAIMRLLKPQCALLRNVVRTQDPWTKQ